jgi:hypothetical protein
MALFQYETGSATDRGFSDLHANGLCAKFKAWVVKTYANGGPVWTILQDRSAAAGYAATVYAVTTTGLSHILTSNAHGLLTGEIIQFTAGTSLPTGLLAATDYYVNRLSADTFRVYTTMIKAWAGGASDINVSSAGVGTQWFTMEGPYIVVSDQAAPTVNQACLILKVGYRSSDSNKIRVQYMLGMDVPNNVVYGYWAGYNITTSASSFTYDIRGGAQCMVIQSLVSTIWYTTYIDTWTGDSNFVEPVTATGTLAGGVAAGANTVLTLGAGQAANFTVNKYYYIYDIGNGHAWVNYCKCTNVNAGANQITVDVTSYAYPTGAVIAAYAHRYMAGGSSVTSANRMNNGYCSCVPYVSSTTAALCSAMTNQNTPVSIYCSWGRDIQTMQYCAPNDEGYYVCQRPMIIEYADQQNGSTGNRYYGVLNNIYLTYNTSLTAGTDGRTIGANNWLYFKLEYNLMNVASSGSIATMFLNTASAS